MHFLTPEKISEAKYEVSPAPKIPPKKPVFLVSFFEILPILIYSSSFTSSFAVSSSKP